jgi:thiamine biosynthesis protein ThiI
MNQGVGMTDYKYVILVSMGEITLKGLNRGRFEARLTRNIKSAISTFGRFHIFQRQSRIWIEDLYSEQPVLDDSEVAGQIMRSVSKVFGIVSVSLVRKFTGDMDNIREMAIRFIEDRLKEQPFESFKFETKRGDKSFPLLSPEVSSELGGKVLERFPELRVDVNAPELVVFVEIRDAFYIYADKIYAHRGLPVGSSGKGLLMLSGGIDSPVAGYMMASRGMEIDAVYYHSFPYTSDQAKQKVVDLAKIISQYCGPIHLNIVNFTEIQKHLYQNSPQDMLTITMRRIMIRIAEKIALQSHCKAIITGESLGQVASQTIDAISLTNEVTSMPIFRPLIGVDKDYAVQIAREIGTFETSILPYEDCCTVFVAKHPQTKPQRKHMEHAERFLDIDDLVSQGLEGIERILIE